MNAAIHLKKLGLDVHFTSRVGQDELGDQLVSYLEGIQFQDYYLQRDGDHPTSIANVDMSDPNDPQYQFPDCAWDYIELDRPMKDLVEEAEMVIYGSLVARNEKSRQTLMKILEGEHRYKVFDVNLRRPNYTRQVIEALLEKADLIKMNEHELTVLGEWFFNTREDEATLLKRLRWRFGAEVIAVTRGGQGASLLWQDDYYRHGGHQVRLVDTIGAGDAFLAGIVNGLLRHEHPREILSLATALGAYVVSQTGGNPTYDMEQIHQLMEQKDPD